MAQLVNVIAPMMVTDDQLWLQTTYFPLQLYANNCSGMSLETLVQCDKYNAGEFTQVPYLDVATVYNPKNQELIINVVNRHLDQAIETTIINQTGQLEGKASIYEINSPEITDENSPTGQKVKTISKEMNVKGNTLVYRFPAHCFTMIKLKIVP